MELRPEDIAEIMRLFADSDLEELHLDVGGTRLDLSKRAGGARAGHPSPHAEPPAPVGGVQLGSVPADAVAPRAAEPAGPQAEGEEDGLVELRSPLLGVFYRRPQPDKPPFVEPGSAVEADDPVCIVDVMKMFTRVPAGTAGTIVEILAEDGQLVEHGEVLMTISPR